MAVNFQRKSRIVNEILAEMGIFRVANNTLYMPKRFLKNLDRLIVEIALYNNIRNPKVYRKEQLLGLNWLQH